MGEKKSIETNTPEVDAELHARWKEQEDELAKKKGKIKFRKPNSPDEVQAIRKRIKARIGSWTNPKDAYYMPKLEDAWAEKQIDIMLSLICHEPSKEEKDKYFNQIVEITGKELKEIKTRYKEARNEHIEEQFQKEVGKPKKETKERRARKKAGTLQTHSSYILDDTLMEEIIDEGTPKFVYLNSTKPTYVTSFWHDDIEIEPIMDDAIKEGAVLLPTGIEDYESVTELVEEIKNHIHKYVDLSEDFELFSAYYILQWFSFWVRYQQNQQNQYIGVSVPFSLFLKILTFFVPQYTLYVY